MCMKTHIAFDRKIMKRCMTAVTRVSILFSVLWGTTTKWIFNLHDDKKIPPPKKNNIEITYWMWTSHAFDMDWTEYVHNVCSSPLANEKFIKTWNLIGRRHRRETCTNYWLMLIQLDLMPEERERTNEQERRRTERVKYTDGQTEMTSESKSTESYIINLLMSLHFNLVSSVHAHTGVINTFQHLIFQQSFIY